MVDGRQRDDARSKKQAEARDASELLEMISRRVRHVT
jgi:hypothetical protein